MQAAADLALVTQLCLEAGVDGGDARIAGDPGEHTVVLLERLGLVARLAGPSLLDRLRAELVAAAYFEAAGIPVPPRPVAPPCPQLALVGGRAVTWWGLLPGPRANWPQLAAVLRRLHDVAVPEPGLQAPRFPVLDPFARLRRQLLAAEGLLPSQDLEVFTRHLAVLADRWARSGLAAAPRVLLHGDAHLANTASLGGRAYLFDFEDVAIGPAAYDLSAVFAFHRLGWIDEHELAGSCDAYGRQVPAEEVEVLTAVRLAQMTGYYAALIARYPQVLGQVRLRISSLTDPALLSSWWKTLPNAALG